MLLIEEKIGTICYKNFKDQTMKGLTCNYQKWKHNEEDEESWEGKETLGKREKKFSLIFIVWLAINSKWINNSSIKNEPPNNI